MNKNNLAFSIPEAFAAAAPDEALPSGDPRYVELRSCRGGENIVDDLARQIIWTRKGYMKLLLTGHRGCGKTTELYRLKSVLEEEGYFVLYWNAERELNLMDVAWIDVILTHVRQLAEQIPTIDPDIKINEGILDSIADWLAKEIVQKVERKEVEAELESKFKIGAEVPFFLKALLGLKAYIRGGTEDVREIRRELERRAITLLNDVNMFIDDLQRQLREKKYT
jgi:DNA polymerase III delta prime subunit